jgi:mannose-6-phosphate isomerase-like protein (cupin superfamily)
MSFPESYPPPRYDGDGEASAWYRPHDAPRDLENAHGGGAAYLATGASTNGELGLYRWDMGPTQGGPGPHFHRTISESFYVLSGTVELYDGTRWFDVGPGGFVHVPVGGVHGFRNSSGAPASMLLLFTPGAPREAYFEGLVDGIGHLTEAEKADFYLRHDNYWL